MERIKAADVGTRKPNSLDRFRAPRRNRATRARTEELFTLARQWDREGFRVLYFTDELRYNCGARLKHPCGVDFVFDPDDEAIHTVVDGTDDVVILDLGYKLGSEVLWMEEIRTKKALKLKETQ